MQTREKIIVFAALLAATYGAYSLFSASPNGRDSSTSSSDTPGDSRAFITALAGAMKKEDKADYGLYVMMRAESKWDKDPFFDRVNPFKSQLSGKDTLTPEEHKGKLPGGVSFTYSGYLEIGQERMAIINGLEYQAGESLEPSSFILREIYPKMVVIAPKKSAKAEDADFVEEEDIPKEIIIPLAE